MIAGSAAEAAEAAPEDEKSKKSVMSGFKSLLKKK
jgi:hypothetical protein